VWDSDRNAAEKDPWEGMAPKLVGMAVAALRSNVGRVCFESYEKPIPLSLMGRSHLGNGAGLMKSPR
jgi:hypothetical protein